ncbi:cullin homolog 1 [Drosophila guanche]|uniref:Blast:Cullin homolog 1 n=1 Tax=Drosophila guanche TaxID=7266 RepID=A0A3B0JR73_DROGU|nr:cullin homolog 1 [Drosophila guanche]SPP76169.1 blast:Cullin homolog 1 [Drosophila guanche]
MSSKKNSFTDFSERLSVHVERIFRNDTTWKRQDLMTLHMTICELCCTVLSESKRSQEAGKKVYLALTNFLTIRLRSIVAELESINDEQELLREYHRCWKSYQASATVLDIGCSYLNENWVKRERLEGRDHVYTIYRLAMITWKTVIFSPIDRSLINAIHHTMVEEIHAQSINPSRIYTVLESIVDMFANDVNQSCSVLEKMNNVFEAKVLKFFEAESKTLFRSIVGSDSHKELKHFVKCAVSCIPWIEHEFCQILSEHLECLLQNDISRCTRDYGRDYVHAMLSLRKLPLLRAFDSIELLAVADLVRVKVINKISDGAEEGNPPKMLALYCHKLLKKNQCSEMLKNELKRIVEVAAFLNNENKKLFTKTYLTLLHKRRIDYTYDIYDYTSYEKESFMISMLRKDLGGDFVERIYTNEMAASKDVHARCQDVLLGIGLKVGIQLRMTFFKVTKLPELSNAMRLPLELEQSVSEFKVFWSQQYTKYGLYLNIQKSQGELTMNVSSLKCYTLQVNTLQMALLLQFNHQNIFAVQKLAENVGTSPETLITALRPLIDRKVLIVGKNSAALTPASCITVCTDYNSKKSLINITNAPVGRVPETNTPKLKTAELDAAIVRIMEREKQLKPQLLIYQVIKEHNLGLCPIKLIKGRIENFMEKKYLELSSDKMLVKLSKCTKD